jgi:hypothetical protein
MMIGILEVLRSLAAEIESIATGQHYIEHNEVDRRRGEDAAHFDAVPRRGHSMAVLAEKLGDELAYLPVVIDHKNVSVSVSKTGVRGSFLPFFHYLPAVQTSS